jgi:uncharacterized protein (TIGR03437 family)
MKFWIVGLFFGSILAAQDLVPAKGPRTEPFLLEPYFEEGSGVSLAASRAAYFSLVSGGMRFGVSGAVFNWMGANPMPQIRWGQSLKGDIREYPGNRIKRRYRSLDQPEIYPNIDQSFLYDIQDRLIWRLTCKPGCDWGRVRIEVPQAVFLNNTPSGLEIRLGNSRLEPRIFLVPSTNATFRIETPTTFGLTAQPGGSVEIILGQFDRRIGPGSFVISDTQGNSYLGFTPNDDFGTPNPYPEARFRGCFVGIGTPRPCTDIAIAKFSKDDQLQYITQFRGGRSEQWSQLTQSPDGQLLLAGLTNSSDFPVTPNAFQPKFSGPDQTTQPVSAYRVDGDHWLARLDPSTGALISATFLGGPQPEQNARFEIAPDGSILIQPTPFASRIPNSPTTPNALQPTCAEPCARYWAARINSSLTNLIYGTYLPIGTTATAMYTDASLYFVGSSGPGLPVSPGAYKTTSSGTVDAFAGRLDPTGQRLLFATYYGGSESDTTYSLAVAPDSSVWFPVGQIESRIVRAVRISGDGTKVLAQFENRSEDLAVDRSGTLHSINRVDGGSGECGLRYHRFNENGTLLTNLAMPGDYTFGFTGLEEGGTPIVRVGRLFYRFDAFSQRSPFIGCALTPNRFQFAESISPGMILTLFGEQLGPTGTKVFINGWDTPVLYASDRQVNIQVPFELATGEPADIEVESAGRKSRLFRVGRVEGTRLEIFPTVLNQNGTLNSPQNPALKGDIIVIWATGAGQTNPPSQTGEITPLALRPLVGNFVAQSPGFRHDILYRGAAPGFNAGLAQINIRLNPDLRPLGASLEGLTPVSVEVTSGGYTSIGEVNVFYR